VLNDSRKLRRGSSVKAKNCLTLSLIAVLWLGCEGSIVTPAGSSTAPAPVNSTTEPKPLDLRALASQYFPGEDTVAPPKRLSRLTRTQLDLTTQFLLSQYYSEKVTVEFPRDPLQTNYEFSENLQFSPVNFTPYTSWVERLAGRVRLNPVAVFDCAATGNSPACLQAEAKKFVAKAFRGTVSDQVLTDYVDFFTSSVPAVGVAAATADLVDVTLTSPNYVFRDEVITDATQNLMPAQELQNIAYTLADVPPDALALSSASPGQYLQSPDEQRRTIAKVMATPQAREKLMRFFTAWLEVKEPDEFTLAPDIFKDFTPDVAIAAVEETQRFLDHQLSKAAPTLKDVTQSTQSFVSQALASIYDNQKSFTGGLVDLDPK
jgi:hypothetical protein